MMIVIVMIVIVMIEGRNVITNGALKHMVEENPMIIGTMVL